MAAVSIDVNSLKKRCFVAHALKFLTVWGRDQETFVFYGLILLGISLKGDEAEVLSRKEDSHDAKQEIPCLTGGEPAKSNRRKTGF
jgi:phosphoheptose isomerase